MRGRLGAAVLAIAVTSTVALTYAQDASDANPADAALLAVRFDEAIVLYEARLADGQATASLHYNLGLAYAHRDELGWAAFHLTQASFLAPGDEDMATALELVRAEVRERSARSQRTGETLTKGEPSTLFWLTFFHRIPATTAELVLLLACWLGFGLLLARRGMRQSAWRDTAFVVGLLSILLAAHALAYRIGAEITNDTIRPAVIVAERPMVYEGPDPNAARRNHPDVFTGAIVIIEEDRPEWLRIEQGWVQREDLSAVDVR